MLRISLCAVSLSFATLSFGAQPSIDNERVTVWDVTGVLPPAQHDFVAVSLSRKGGAIFGHKGDTPGKAGARSVIIELKDHAVPPIGNATGYPLAFPRPHVKKLLENDKVIVWDYVWRPKEPTPMHFHDKDTVTVDEEHGDLKSTTPDGKSVVSEHQFGDVRFNRRDRTHTEVLVRGQAHAVITELR
jgi:hypothetical protein